MSMDKMALNAVKKISSGESFSGAKAMKEKRLEDLKMEIKALEKEDQDISKGIGFRDMTDQGGKRIENEILKRENEIRSLVFSSLVLSNIMLIATNLSWKDNIFQYIMAVVSLGIIFIFKYEAVSYIVVAYIILSIINTLTSELRERYSI